jgi:uncharacterized membrane-anchored protein
MGTALGDFTAYTLKLGFFPSTALFAAMIAVPAVAYAVLRRHEVLLFWLAYVVTRPLGASTADGLGKPKDASGLGLGNGAVALALAGLIGVLVAYLSVTRADLQAGVHAEVGLETEGA